MAARNPTTWNAFTNELQFMSGKSILASASGAPVDDLTYVLDCEQLGVSECFFPREVTYAADANNWVEIARYYLDVKDMCNEAGVASSEIACQWTAYCWGDGTRIPGVRVTTTATSNNDSTNTGAASATPAWSSFGHTSLNIETDDNENTIILYGRVESPGAAGSIWVAGLGLFVSET